MTNSRRLANRTVLISGASVAGPALAFWLRRHGFTPTVVELAPELREGGYKVDLRGVAMQVVERMGMLDAVRRSSTAIRGGSWVARSGKPLATLGPDLIGMRAPGDDEVMRGDLARLLHEATRDSCEYLFGDTITGLHEGPDGVDVTFRHAPPRRFDLVIGADGLHSTVRRLVFGPEERHVHPLGMHAAVFTVPNHLGLDHWELLYPTPGKVVNVYATRPDTAKAQFVFPSPAVLPGRYDRAAQQRILAEAFAGVGWESETLLRAMPHSPDFYFTPVSQVRMDHWSAGRVVLVGDAAYSPSPLSGQGTSLALVGAYVLAGELSAAAGDHRAAYAGYREAMRSYVDVNVALGASNAAQMVAGSPMQIKMQTTMMRLVNRLPWKDLAMRPIMKPLNEAANALTLAAY
ncbi:FAD-dependent monooxygenase [Nonomuraea roseoviolacea subsp. roseoviolacea]|uniref:2-polyprenyl-6-methoxyphenol hydroxylase-like FAD-dependent oxidoreductase n=1 Tax=Nonomuraea roseoviolacea subsp. carminata TaxID=160689 RepID=A0ABT1K5N8_9ACTN|nr:FAD-dependent monooxygenase [Nonomuraea roseoviolacea]MCP2349322.1 2-polyprenyl-6-methoxyphenol hydroxylase-like FAD-dependent oxidoreductase [Nonomuraea roseoviolacea subsp. carminata]